MVGSRPPCGGVPLLCGDRLLLHRPAPAPALPLPTQVFLFVDGQPNSYYCSRYCSCMADPSFCTRPYAACPKFCHQWAGGPVKQWLPGCTC